jgi:hypothetical protein
MGRRLGSARGGEEMIDGRALQYLDVDAARLPACLHARTPDSMQYHRLL